MMRYVVKRILGLIPLFFGITLISFFIMHLAPGKPSDLQTQMNPRVSLEARQRLEKLYGLDRPLHIQYGKWLIRLMRCDFGRSFTDDRPVIQKILERLPITIFINLISLFLILTVAIPIGVRAGTRPHSFFDQATTLFVFLGYSVPSFWLALLLISFFGITLGWLPVLGIHSLNYEMMPWYEKIWDLKRHLFLPIFVSAFGGLAGISRYMRGSMLEVMRQDYIRTARAKGLPEKTVIYKHALRNALLPIVTLLGLSLPGLIGGSVIFETIFAIPGAGRLFYEAVLARDYPLLMGELVIGSVLTLLGNLFADLGYAAVDPRIRLSGKE